MPRLLIVHHTPSPALQEMFEAAVSGARTDEIEGVEVVIRPALTAAAVDVLEADAYLLGTPANIGYMSGALKHFFDGIYYPCLEATRRRPYGLYVHGNLDTTGAVRAVESITTGLRWRAVRPPVCVTGPPGKKDLEACWDLGALLAAEVAGLVAAALPPARTRPSPPFPARRMGAYRLLEGTRPEVCSHLQTHVQDFPLGRHDGRQAVQGEARPLRRRAARLHGAPRARDLLLIEGRFAQGGLRMPRSEVVRGARGWPLMTAVFHPFWHGTGTNAGVRDGCQLTALARRLPDC